MSVQLRAGAVAARAKFDGGIVLQAYRCPISPARMMMLANSSARV